MKMIKLAIVSTAITLSSGSLAIGYDANSTQPSGDRITERHVWQTKLATSDCNSLCQALHLVGGEETEMIGIFSIANATGCTPSATQCNLAPAEADTYCGGNLSSTTSCDTDFGTGNYSSNAPNQDTLSQFSPLANPTGIPEQPISIEFGTDNVFLTAPFAWKLETNVKGKITDGFYITEITFLGVSTLVAVNFSDASSSTGASLTVYTSNPTGSQTIDIDCLLDGDSTDCNVDNGGGGTDWINGDVVFNNYTPLSYITGASDEVGGAKAVPMPAFAAAALGLGLMGVSLLTGSRRRMKEANLT